MTFQRFATVLLFLAIATAACLMPAQSDTFWQLRAGQEMAASGNVMLHDAFTYSVRGGFWPNHEWLSEVLFYGLWRVGGMPALTAFAASMALLAWVLVWRVMTGPALWRCALILLVLIPSAKLWSIRPQVISLALLAILLVQMTRERWRRVPVLFLVWANLHGGVMLGVIALTGALAARVVVARSQWKPAALVLAASVAAVCLTPLGVTVWIEVPHMLGRLRSYGVAEWRAVDVADPLNSPFFIVAAALVVCTCRRWRHLDRNQAALLGAAAALFMPALESDRNVAPFLIAAVAALSRMAPEIASRFERFETSVRQPRHVVFAVAAAAGCLALVAATWAHPPGRMNWSPLPTGVAAAVEGCQGNLYNQYDNGGYLIWFAPRKPVFIDSRQDPFPPALVLAHRSVEMTGNYTALFDRFDVGCAALPPRSRTAEALLKNGWMPSVRDVDWVVLSRKR